MLAWRQALYNAPHLTKEMFVTAPEIQWIRDDASLAQQCREWRTQPYLALDTEFMRVDTFYPAAGLVQVGDGRQEWLIDPLLIQDWSPFAELLEDERVVKVLHACSEDLEVFLRLTGSLPVPLFDTQLAAAYLGMAHSMGYSKLVKEVLDIDLPKDETRSDWLQRPLTEMQMRYAADDVQHLAQVYLALDARLSEEKRAWLLEDGAELVANLCRESDPREAYREVKLGWRLRPQQLAVLRELCAWREEQARLRNRPRNHVLRERTLWPLARLLPKNKTDLAAIEDMHPRTVRQDGDFLIELIAQAARLPQSEWPEALPEPLPPEVTPLLEPARHRPARSGDPGHGARTDAAQESPRGTAQERLSRRSLRTARFPPRLAPRTHGPGPAGRPGERMKRICSVYKSPRKSEMYLYVDKREALSRVPEALLVPFGAPQHVFDLLLTPERQLAREDVAKVLENIEKQGFHLQMPPGEEEYIEHLPEELLRMNDPL